MAVKRRQFSWDHPIVIFLVLIAIIASMSLAAEVLKPLALAILLSFVLSPVVRFLERRKLPRAAAVILTVVLALGALSGVGYVVYRQLDQMAADLPRYEKTITAKLNTIHLGGSPKLDELEKVGQEIKSRLTETKKPEPGAAAGGPAVMTSPATEAIPVRVVSQPSLQKQLGESVGPYLEVLGSGAFILILVLFLLTGREDLADRVIQLFGRRRVTLTTRTMEEVGQRISRYLGMFATVNSSFGLIVGLGLWAIGVKYAVLWGFLAAALRFIPYIGPGTAIVLPLAFSFASSPNWNQPLMVLALFGVMEVIANSFLEPIIYGKTTGVSALGLLVAAMFWTWLWGPLGLLMSTPMTVCLAVLGKSVPSLGFFAVLLGEESELPQDVRYYQRLLALDQDGASEIMEEALKTHPRAEAYDKVLIPALSKAERDFARDELDDREAAFALRVTSDIVDELDGVPDITLTAAIVAPGPAPDTDGAPPKRIMIAGIPASDAADALVLRMLAQLLAPAGCTLEVITDRGSALKVAEAVAAMAPDLIVLSHLPPVGLTPARYLVRRLRVRFEALPILVGRWGEAGDAAGAAEGLTGVGATKVAFSLTDARDQILEMVRPKKAAKAIVPPMAAGVPA